MCLNELQFNAAIVSMKKCDEALHNIAQVLHFDSIIDLGAMSLVNDFMFNLYVLYKRGLNVTLILDELTYCHYKTFKAFLDSGLNVSKTAVNLGAHRNTVTYRLSQLSKSTNCNIDVFANVLNMALCIETIDNIAFANSYAEV